MFRFMLHTRIKSTNQQRAITHKVLKVELGFLCAILSPNALYHGIKFHSISFGCFEVMLQTRKWRQTNIQMYKQTDGQTDGQTDRQTDQIQYVSLQVH